MDSQTHVRVGAWTKTSGAVQAALLLCARVVVLAKGDEALVRVLLPQILVLALRQGIARHVRGCLVFALAHICVACSENGCRCELDKPQGVCKHASAHAPVWVLLLSTSDPSLQLLSISLSPSTRAATGDWAHTEVLRLGLGQVQNCQRATHCSDAVRWGFERASEPLLKMYRFPRDPAAAALLHRGVRRTGKSGSSISSGQSTPPSTPSPPGSEDGQSGERAAHAWEAEGQNTLADALAVIGSHAHAFSPEFRCRVLLQTFTLKHG